VFTPEILPAAGTCSCAPATGQMMSASAAACPAAAAYSRYVVFT
jgi:hypothetical protein